MERYVTQLIDALRTRGQTLSAAESCTGGLVASALVSVSGASSVFRGGLIPYDPQMKIRILGVSPESIRLHDVVSEAVAREMAEGACRVFETDCAVATTGYADVGTAAISGGTVCFAYVTPRATVSETLHFSGDRNAVRTQAAAHALAALCGLVTQ